jgi:predicted peptidase
VSGAGEPGVAARIKNVPLWAFHGDNDLFVPFRGLFHKEIPVYGTKDMVEAISAAGGQPRLTVMEHYGHMIPCHVFRNPDVLAWLFRQKRSTDLSWHSFRQRPD